MTTVSTCVRCGASPFNAANDGGCEQCGALPSVSTAEALRQERALAWALKQVLDADDAAAVAGDLQVRSVLRIRMLSASTPSTDPTRPPDAATEETEDTEDTEDTDGQGAGAEAVDATVPEAAAVTDAPSLVAPPPTPPEDAGGAPPRRPQAPRHTQGQRRAPGSLDGVGIGAPVAPSQARRGPPRPHHKERPPPPPPLSPAEARALFERRLEIGGWFTGAIFAVGGSLWATNLFWADIPAALRPVVVGGGLAAFAAAFMALGAVLATRHGQSLAGPVLGLVGRLIGVSATIPLAMLRQENLPLWLATTAVVVAALTGGLRFAHRRRAPDADDVFDATPYFLVGFVLAATGPAMASLAIPVAVACLLVARAGVGAGTLPALAGQRTWVDDVSIAFVGVGGALAAVFHARGDLGPDLYAETWAVALVACVELVARLVEQRLALYPWRWAARWGLALWSFGTAFSVIDHNVSPVLAAGALLFVAAATFEPARLSLPRFMSFTGIIAAAWAAAFMSRTLSLTGDVADAAAVVTGLLALLLLTTHHRRGTPDGGERVVSFFVWWGAVIVALAVDDDVGRIIATTMAALLFVTDRRMERSVAFAFLAIPVALVPFGLSVAEFLPKRFVLPSTVASVAVVAVLLHALRLARPERPLLSATTAAAWWTVLAGGVTALAAPEHPAAFAATVVCAVALFALQERSRQADPGLFGAALVAVVMAILMRDVTSTESLRPAFAFAAVALALLSFLPMSGLAHGPALSRGWYRLGRARHARPFSLGIVAVGLVTIMLAFRLPMIPSETGPLWHAMTAALVGAAALLVWRAPSSLRITVLVGAVVVMGSDVGVAVDGRVPLVAMGFGGGLVALVVAAIAVLVRRLDLATAVLERGTRRLRRGGPASDALAAAAGVAALCADLGALVGLAGAPNVETGLLLLSLLLLLVTAHAFVLFASLPSPAFVVLGVGALASAPLALALRSLLEGDEVPTLVAALSSVAVLAVALVAARALYRRRAVPSVLRQWPPPWSLRTPALAMLITLTWGLALLGVGLQLDHATDIATRYGPGLVIVGVALAAVAVLAWRTRRSLAVGVLGGIALGLVGTGLDSVAHAAHWVPKSYGDSQALVALGLVGAALLLDRVGGRAALWRLRLGWPRLARQRLVGLLSMATPALVALAVLLAVRDAPRAHELAIVLGGAALIGLGFGLPSPTTARGAAMGVVLGGAGLAAAIARIMSGADLALTATALPAVALGGLLGAVLVQTGARRAWRAPWMEDFHAGRVAADDGLLHRCAAAMRGAAEGGGLLLLAVVVAVAVAEDRAAPLALWSTWLAMGLAIWLTSRMALDGEQTWPAALGQGMALAIYVDIRRRTPWLDGVAGIDVIACLAGAAVFVLVGMASRRQPRGASTARAAEIYAVTLPVIAAGLGDSDAGRALICLMGGGLYALLARTRRNHRYEFAAGLALVAATTLALSAQGTRDATLYLLPVAFVGTFLARRHRSRMGSVGRSLAVWCHVPLYCASAWSALQTETFTAFALGVVITTGGVIYSIRVKDRRSLYAAAAAAAVLVVGRLVLLGLDNALLGTLLLAGAGILLLGGMTVFTIRRDAASDAVKRAASGLDDWE